MNILIMFTIILLYFIEICILFFFLILFLAAKGYYFVILVINIIQLIRLNFFLFILENFLLLTIIKNKFWLTIFLFVFLKKRLIELTLHA